MADNGTIQNQNTRAWPLPRFYFKVSIPNVGELVCSEVSGIDPTPDIIEYRAGDSSEFSKLKMPGLSKATNITLKKGVFKDSASMWNWLNGVKINAIQRETVTISLIDETGDPIRIWELTKAWPTKVSVDSFESDGNAVAIETLVIAHEGVSVK